MLAVVSSAIYLSGHDGEILWLGRPGLPAHRRCILAPFRAENVEAGMDFVATGRCLTVGDAMTVDLAHADSWVPHTITRTLPQGVVKAHVREVLEVTQSLPVSGLGHTLALITQPVEHTDYSTVSTTESILLNRAEPVIQELIVACRRRDLERIVQAGLNLVGLGPGLTPSGDDYLGGLLFSVYYLKAAYPSEFTKEDDPLDDFLSKARLSTNHISYTILSDLAYGHGPAPLHDLIRFLLQGSEEQPWQDSAKQLIRIGHTSGWDMLAGALTGMLLCDPIDG